jgi:Domain of unknown function (DUF4112)
MKNYERPPLAARRDDADLEFLAGLMDDRFYIPGTNIRFGLDSVVGLIPGFGDTIGGVVSSYIIWRAQRMGASNWVLLRMTGNMLFDTALGVVPLVGDIFDWKFRANRRNLELLRRHQTQLTPPPSARVADNRL